MCWFVGMSINTNIYLFFYLYMSKKKSLRFWEAAFKRKAVRPEVCLQLWLFVCCCFCVLGCWICAGAALLYVLKFLVSNHMFFFHCQEIAYVKSPLSRSWVLSFIRFDALVHIWNVFFFVSLFQCLTVLALAVVFLCSVVPGAVSEQGDRGCGSVFSSEGRFAV